MKDHPGFVDLQVNGCHGIDFNSDSLHCSDVAEACRRLRSDGVAGILATVITDEVPAMCRRLERIQELRSQNPLIADVVWGIHVEGPFLSSETGYVGAHSVSATRSADPDIMKQLLDAADGLIRLVTLAPERDPGFAVTRWLCNQNIRVAAGHCNPTTNQLCAAIDAGVSMFTHLGNACPMLLNRHDNIIQRVLAMSDRLWVGFIADGIHVPFQALRNYLRVVGVERAFVVTDAIQAAGLGPGAYQLGGQSVVVDEQLATWDEGRSHLIGSAVRMTDVVAKLKQDAGLFDRDIELLTSTNPRRILNEARIDPAIQSAPVVSDTNSLKQNSLLQGT
jgi:N-acetylglucosamine-6-phosphate deacetylase